MERFSEAVNIPYSSSNLLCLYLWKSGLMYSSRIRWVIAHYCHSLVSWPNRPRLSQWQPVRDAPMFLPRLSVNNSLSDTRFLAHLYFPCPGPGLVHPPRWVPGPLGKGWYLEAQVWARVCWLLLG